MNALHDALARLGDVAVAVSGGVDSMTLAVIAHRDARVRATMFHAISPAVSPEATARVRSFAAREGWSLHVFDAGEFDDPSYLSNPVDRCFHCKRNLYEAIAPRTAATIVSGTNTDDLGDYRPGLQAASQHGVRHPYVEAGVDKAGVRVLARAVGCAELAELPAAPCLASRVETGIAIEPRMLTVVHEVERELGRRLAPQAVRCRVRAGRVVVELDAPTLQRLSAADRRRVCEDVAGMWRARGLDRPVSIESYRMGGAFLHG